MTTTNTKCMICLLTDGSFIHEALGIVKPLTHHFHHTHHYFFQPTPAKE